MCKVTDPGPWFTAYETFAAKHCRGLPAQRPRLHRYNLEGLKVCRPAVPAPPGARAMTRVLIWQGAGDSHHVWMYHPAVYCIFYQTEPGGGARSSAPTKRGLHEVWDYSLKNIEVMLARGSGAAVKRGELQSTLPVIRYVPPGWLGEHWPLRTRQPAMHTTRFIGARRPCEIVNRDVLRTTHYERASGIWSRARWQQLVDNTTAFVNMHKACKSTTKSVGAFRMSQLLSPGPLVVSALAHLSDMAAYRGLVHPEPGF